MPKTTILLEMETRQLLRKVGRKEQTYDMLIKELVAKCEKCEKEKELSGSGHGFPTGTAARQTQYVRESKGADI